MCRGRSQTHNSLVINSDPNSMEVFTGCVHLEKLIKMNVKFLCSSICYSLNSYERSSLCNWIGKSIILSNLKVTFISECWQSNTKYLNLVLSVSRKLLGDDSRKQLWSCTDDLSLINEIRQEIQQQRFCSGSLSSWRNTASFDILEL